MKINREHDYEETHLNGQTVIEMFFGAEKEKIINFSSTVACTGACQVSDCGGHGDCSGKWMCD